MHSLWLGYVTTQSVLTTYNVLGQQCFASVVERMTLFQQYTLSVLLFIERESFTSLHSKGIDTQNIILTNTEQDKKNLTKAQRIKEKKSQHKI